MEKKTIKSQIWKKSEAIKIYGKDLIEKIYGEALTLPASEVSKKVAEATFEPDGKHGVKTAPRYFK